MNEVTYEQVVDFVREHADHLGDTIGESQSALDILSGTLSGENCHVDDLQDDIDSVELRGDVIALAELADAVLGQMAR